MTAPVCAPRVVDNLSAIYLLLLTLMDLAHPHKHHQAVIRVRQWRRSGDCRSLCCSQPCPVRATTCMSIIRGVVDQSHGFVRH